MDAQQAQSALREWRQHMARPATIGVLLGVGAILALAGPFGTGEAMRPPARLAYWLVIASATWSAGWLASDLTGILVRSLPRGARAILPSLATGAAVTLAVLVLNWALVGTLPDLPALPAFAGAIFAIGVIVELIAKVMEPRFAKRPEAPAAPASILRRLPLEARGALVALSAEDHYTRVRTDRGEALVLLRLADAMRETGGVAGLQVHRSHWVALAQVRAARRDGERAVLRMARGPDVPVSRRHLPAARDAGLLPRGCNG